MRHSIRTTAPLACALLLCAPLAPRAQSQPPPVITPHEVTRDPAYGRAVLLRRVQTDITYVADLEGELPLEGVPLTPAATEDDAAERDPSAVSRVLVFGVLAALAVMLFMNRAYLRRLFGGKTTAPAPGRKAAQVPPPPERGLLARLASADNREAALVELVEAVLSAAARANDLRLGRSETARELLRRLPRDWPHLGGLRTIVMTEELVQFGGRPLGPDAFHTCLHEAHPILRAAGEA